MRCSICDKRTDGEPVVMLVVKMDDRFNTGESGRFTGVVWHAGCAPASREHLAEECRRVSLDPTP